MNNGMGNEKLKNWLKNNYNKRKEENEMTEKLLPLGSIVYLKEATAKLMIVGRGASFDNGEGQVFSDYVGVVYPNGIDPEDALFFNHQDVDKLIFTGYSDEEEERYLEVYDAWQQGLVDASENETYTAESISYCVIKERFSMRVLFLRSE